MGVREVVSDDSLTVIPQGDLFALIDVLMTLTELSKTLRPICQDNRVQLKRFSVEEMLSSKLSLYESLLSSECE
jgi:hypothetical protein